MKRSILSCVLVLAIAFPNALLAQSSVPATDKYANHEVNVKNAARLPTVLAQIQSKIQNENQQAVFDPLLATTTVFYLLSEHINMTMSEIEILHNLGKFRYYLMARDLNPPGATVISDLRWLNATMNELDKILDFDFAEGFVARERTYIDKGHSVARLEREIFKISEIRDLLVCLQNLKEYPAWIKTPESIRSVITFIDKMGVASAQEVLSKPELFKATEIHVEIIGSKKTNYNIEAYENGRKPYFKETITRTKAEDVVVGNSQWERVQFSEELRARHGIVINRRLLGAPVVVGLVIGAAVIAYSLLSDTNNQVATNVLDQQNLTLEDVVYMIMPSEIDANSGDHKYDPETYSLLLAEPGFAKKMSMLKDNIEAKMRERNQTMKDFNAYVASLKG